MSKAEGITGVEVAKMSREGVFADERIHANTFIGIYAGEFVTDEEGERRGKSVDFVGFIVKIVLISM